MFCGGSEKRERFFLKRGKNKDHSLAEQRSLWRKKNKRKKNKFEVLHMLQYRRIVAIIHEC